MNLRKPNHAWQHRSKFSKCASVFKLAKLTQQHQQQQHRQQQQQQQQQEQEQQQQQQQQRINENNVSRV